MRQRVYEDYQNEDDLKKTFYDELLSAIQVFRRTDRLIVCHIEIQYFEQYHMMTAYKIK